MRKENKTQAIVLSKINYAEYDRIVTILSKDFGKLKVMVRGIRRQNSKLASSLDFFSVSNVTIYIGKSEINRLISANLSVFYDNILTDIDRVDTAFQFMKIMNKTTETDDSSEYFDILNVSLAGLNDMSIDRILVINWFYCQFLNTYGHMPNLTTSQNGKKLNKDENYIFSLDDFTFHSSNLDTALFTDDIKYLRLLFSLKELQILNNIKGTKEINIKLFPIIEAMFRSFNLV